MPVCVYVCVCVQVNWSIKDCRNSFAWQASHLRLGSSCEIEKMTTLRQMGVDSATKCCKPVLYNYDDDDVVDVAIIDSELNELLRKFHYICLCFWPHFTFDAGPDQGR